MPVLPQDVHAVSYCFLACTKTKTDGGGGARQVYGASRLFRAAYQWATVQGFEIYILSAKYGLLRPTDRIESYQQTLVGASAVSRTCWT